MGRRTAMVMLPFFDIIINKEYEVVDKDATTLPMPDKPKWYPGRAALEHNLTWRN